MNILRRQENRSAAGQPLDIVLTEKNELKKLLSRAFWLRLTVCILVLVIGDLVGEQYFIADDAKYEGLAKSYIFFARSVVDIDALDYIGVLGYLQPFWPIVACILAYIFRTMYAARFLNVILATVVVKVLYELTHSLSGNHKTAIRAAKLYAYLPYPILVCCFPIKDIFLTVATMYAFLLLVKFQKSERVHFSRWILGVLLMVGAYFTRGGVAELILLFAVAYAVKRFWERRNHVAIVGVCLLAVVGLLLWGETVMDAFATKVDDYGSYALLDTTISAMQMSHWWEFYKLPFAYFFASLQPIPLSWFTPSSMKIWGRMIYFLNLAIIPVACGNFLYIFCKKKNWLYWLTTVAMYCAVATLSLGIFRHYMFLLPLEMINFALYLEDGVSVKVKNCALASVALFALLFLYSLYQFL